MAGERKDDDGNSVQADAYLSSATTRLGKIFARTVREENWAAEIDLVTDSLLVEEIWASHVESLLYAKGRQQEGVLQDTTIELRRLVCDRCATDGKS